MITLQLTEMNFQAINSPSDLLKANETNPIEDLLNQIDDLGPGAALAVAQLLTDKLQRLHCQMSQRDDVKNPYIWAQDAGMLEVVVNILNNIQL